MTTAAPPAADADPSPGPFDADLSADRDAPAGHAADVLRTVLHTLASLKICVTLLALSLFLVLAGTLAQVSHDIWEVVHNYFRCWVAYVPVADLVPTTWFPPGTLLGEWATADEKYGFHFPGGWTLGLALGVNQIASMLTKFKVKARGTKLWVGLGVTAVGAVATWAVVVSGMGGDEGPERSAVGYDLVWRMIQVVAAAAGVGLTVWAGVRLADPAGRTKPDTPLIAAAAAIAVGLAIWSLFVGTVSDSSGRILWQLIKASFAAAVLLAGLLPLFGRQGGTLLLHCGLLLLLASEFHTGVYAREGVISLQEGEAKNFVSDTRSFELAVVETGDDGTETHHVISGDALLAAAEAGETIADDRLPVTVEPLVVFRNSAFEDAGAAGTEPNPADLLPAGKKFGLREREPGTGVDVDASTDVPGGLFRLREKAGNGRTGEVLGTALGWALLPDDLAEPVTVGGTEYRVQLRFAREYLPFRVALKDVRADFYPGTAKPSHYSSDLRIDPRRGTGRGGPRRPRPRCGRRRRV